MSVADNQLALAAPDRYQRVNNLQTCLHRFMHAAAGNNAGGFNFRIAELFGFNFAQTVNRFTQGVDHAPQKLLADRHADDSVGAFDQIAFFNAFIRTENHDADAVFFQIERHAFNPGGKLHHFVGLHIVQTINLGNAVADRQNAADFAHIGFQPVLGNFLF